MTDANTTIESVLQEQRVFEPPADTSAKARIGSLEAYRAMADAAKNDPDAFWGEAARRELHWFEPFHTVLDWSNPPSRAGLRAAPRTSPTTAWTVISMGQRRRKQR